jgi:hypothetical protein
MGTLVQRQLSGDLVDLVIWLFGSFALLDFTYLQTQFLRSNRLLKI